MSYRRAITLMNTAKNKISVRLRVRTSAIPYVSLIYQRTAECTTAPFKKYGSKKSAHTFYTTDIFSPNKPEAPEN